MSGEEILHLRIDRGLKAKAKAAAARRSESLTTFATKAIEKAIAEAQKLDGRAQSGSLQRALAEAAKGGAMGYLQLGRRVGSSLRGLVKGRGSREKLEELSDELGLGSEATAFAWFERELPKLAETIPPRRRGQFLMGVRAFDDERGLAPWVKPATFRQGRPGGES